MNLRYLQNFRSPKRIRKSDDFTLPAAPASKKSWLNANWIIIVTLGLILIYMFPRGQSLQFADFKEGSISPRRIVAPYSFEILKTEAEYDYDRQLTAQKVYPIFQYNDANTETVREKGDLFCIEIESARNQYLSNITSRQAVRDSIRMKFPITGFENKDWDYLLNPRGEIGLKDFETFKRTLKTVLRDVHAVGILDHPKSEIGNPDRRLIIAKNSEEEVYSVDDFYEMSEARTKSVEMLNNAFPTRQLTQSLCLEIIDFMLKPNIIYQETLHLQRVEEAQKRVPLSNGFVQENEKIVDKNEKITSEIRKKLTSLAFKMAERGEEEGGVHRLTPFLGRLGFVSAVFLLFFSYFQFDHSIILRRTKYVLLLSLIFLFITGMTYFLRQMGFSEYLIPTTIGAMLLATIFNPKVGFVGISVLCVLVGGIWGNDFNVTIVSFITGVMGVYIINHVRNRSQLLRAIVFMIGINLFSITVIGFLHYLPFRDITALWKFGTINGLFTPIIAYGLLALVEPLFDITTDFSLLELSNLNHPILKRLSVEATGTYHHSIMVGNLAEAAAYAVEANSLLARVGSYYHDIGKLEKAEYFIENQIRNENPHKKLTPRMSALILSNHIKKGVELADQYKLPSAIKDIMIQHHGKTVMMFFYQKAIKKNNPEDVNENDYRYPGPLPQTKEAAIVMLADSVEAATRALKEPTHSRIKGVIEEIVDERFQSGELDETPLALRDLEQIKISFLTILAGVFHTRTEYPEKEENKSGSVKKNTKDNHAED